MERINEHLKPNLRQYAHLFERLSSGNGAWKIGAYVRLSKEDGNSVSLSVINQIKKIARSLRRFDDYILSDIYIDDGKTGTDFDRSDYIRLEEDIASGAVNCMIVKDLTRYARNVAEGIRVLDDFVLKHKIRFISLGIPEIDTYKDPTAISSAEVYGALNSAEDHARTTSKKVRDIKAIKREDGEKNGGFPPYGYLPNPDGEHWLYDPVAGEIVKQMYLWSASGVSDMEIAKRLNAQGVLNPTAYKKSIGLNYHSPHSEGNSGLWWASTVKRILEDKTNIGCSVQGKSSSFDHKRHKQIRKAKEEYVVVEGCHEKAVPEELFDMVSRVRSQRSRATKSEGTVHVFANLVYCGDCHIAMRKTSAKGHEYLVCRTYKDAGKEFCAHKRSVRFKALEEIVLEVIRKQIAMVIGLQALVDEINEQPHVDTQSVRINQLIENSHRAFAKEERLLDSSYYDWKEGEISKEQYQRVREEAEKRLEQIRATLQMLQVQQEEAKKGVRGNNQYFQSFLKYQNAVVLDRLMLVELISRIYINADKSVKVEFNFSDQYLRVMDFIERNREKQGVLSLKK
jgi:ElaB/YqjD/DUF883 family membrane-anchored ribosome-binding protein